MLAFWRPDLNLLFFLYLIFYFITFSFVSQSNFFLFPNKPRCDWVKEISNKSVLPLFTCVSKNHAYELLALWCMGSKAVPGKKSNSEQKWGPTLWTAVGSNSPYTEKPPVLRPGPFLYLQNVEHAGTSRLLTKGPNTSPTKGQGPFRRLDLEKKERKIFNLRID